MNEFVKNSLCNKCLQRNYMGGVLAYNDEDWPQCVHYFENSLDEFFVEEKRCRLICEDMMTWELIDSPNPEYIVVATSITFYLNYFGTLEYQIFLFHFFLLINYTKQEESFDKKSFYINLHHCKHH